MDEKYINERFDLISETGDNWYQGGEIAFDKNKVNEVRKLFLEFYKSDLTPSICPFPDRFINFEWDYKNGMSYSLEINSGSFESTFYIFDMNDDTDKNDKEININIHKKEDWDIINNFINN